MTDTIASGRRSIGAQSRYFYFHMALVCMAVAFIGFLPTYWIPVARGTAQFDPVVHIHGMIFFGWTIFYAFQTWVVANGQIARHRLVGLIGVSFITAMVIFGVMVAMHSMHARAAHGQVELGLSRSIVALSDIFCFAVLMTGALINIPRPEWHKRLMLMAAISILGAPIFRWFITLSSMPRPLPLYLAIEAQVLVILLCLVPILRDWRANGQVHPAYVWGFSGVALTRVAQATLGPTVGWHAVAGWVSSLG